MDKAAFESQYPEIASLLGNHFWSKVDPHHLINFCVVMDNQRGLDYISKLVGKTPAKRIASSYENDLYTRRGFDSFLSELVGYIATKRWLCPNPEVLDVKGTENLPEFACEDVDIEVTRIRESHEEDRIRVHLMDELGGGCTAYLRRKRGYDDYASDGRSWAENERYVDELIEKLGGISHGDLPLVIETDVLELQVRESNVATVAYMGGGSMGQIIPDQHDQIVRGIKQKTGKCRDDRPLIVFFDLNIQTVDRVEEVIWETIGEPYSFAYRDTIRISPHVEAATNIWEDYLTGIEAVPGGDTSPTSAVPPGDEGVFMSDEVSSVAGIMVRFYTGEVAYVPNVYTDTVASKDIFNRLGWGTETRSLSPSNI